MASTFIKIDGAGFLTEQLANSLAGRTGINRALASTVIDALRYANQLASELQAPIPHSSPQEKQRAIAVVLFVRVIEIFEATVVLAACGVREEQRTLFRVFLDAYFVLANVCSDPDFVAAYFRTDQVERLKLIHASARYEDDLFGKLNEYATEEVRDGIKKMIKEEAIQNFNSFEFAKNVGCEKIYDSMYRIYGASVHTSPRCLENYVRTDAQGNITEVVHREDVETTDCVLYDCGWFFLKAIRGVQELFQMPGAEAVTHYEQAFEAAVRGRQDP